MKNEFGKITVSDSWGHLEYRLDGKRINLGDGDPVEILWPDGTASKHNLKKTHVQFDIPDHGHSYRGTTYKYNVWVDHKGFKVHVPLEDGMMLRFCFPG